MTAVHAGVGCLAVGLATFLAMSTGWELVGALPVRVGPASCECRPARIWLTARGGWLDGKPVTSSELPERLGRVSAVTLEADDGVPYGEVVHLIDALRGAGVTEVGVLP